MPDPRSSSDTVVRQIQKAWEEAQAQLAELKEQVQHAAALAEAKVQSTALERELDAAYRALGAAVWAEVTKGRLQLSPQLATVRKALEVVSAKVQAEKASIRELLAEGEELGRRIQEKKSRTSKGVANPPKRR